MADTLPSQRRPDKSTTGYLPTLDGWRAVAIFSILLYHDAEHRFGFLSTAWFQHHGGVGVDIFFAISGLLICSRLLAEEESRGNISLRNFYTRRAFRILPAATIFLAVLLLLKVTVHLLVGVPEVLASLAFVRNYTFTFLRFQTAFPYYTSHFWSLAVEEHFYLFLPALLVFAPKHLRIPLLLLLAGIIGIHRTAHNSWYNFHTDMRLDALLVPAAFAVALRNERNRQRFATILRFWPILAGSLLVSMTLDKTPRTNGLLLAWLMPLVILATMLRPQSWFGQILELAPLRFVGRLSYSLYLWQQLFLLTHFGGANFGLGRLQTLPFNWVMTFICAMLSYYLIEQPLIRLGHKFAPNVKANRIERSEG